MTGAGDSLRARRASLAEAPKLKPRPVCTPPGPGAPYAPGPGEALTSFLSSLVASDILTDGRDLALVSVQSTGSYFGPGESLPNSLTGTLDSIFTLLGCLNVESALRLMSPMANSQRGINPDLYKRARIRLLI
eukprot:CAMPEP_0117556644 /NCGR_PEP_ID=MMETSP0784-20121206/51915_1 /TAXON_ID=39447 /ORGANISM="" /LENGTH=132 /DNA_ID=CAMNT_0005353925 /DNA_START=353 /DNA_END=752 /DNA_ORIENTATION=-